MHLVKTDLHSEPAAGLGLAGNKSSTTVSLVSIWLAAKLLTWLIKSEMK